jgi:hypothetical protein
MNIKYAILKDITDEDKLRFMKFVYDNTNSFIMNTFGFTWESRDYWNKFPIEVCLGDNNQVLGLHAYTVNDKYPSTLKTYYIVTRQDQRGKGIAKIMIKNAVYKYRDIIEKYYANSDINSDGAIFYRRWFGKNKEYKQVKNEFNSHDLIFEEPIYNIIDETT